MDSIMEELADEGTHGDDDLLENREDNTAESSATSSELRSRKRSDIWQFITDHGNGTYSCKCCEREDRQQMWNSKAHTTMRNHLKSYHKNEYGGGADAPTAKQTKLLCYGFERFVKQRFESEFSKDEADSALIEWIVGAAQPFAVVEQPKFIAFCCTLQPAYKVPVRQTVRNRVIARWKMEKELARKIIVYCLVFRDVGSSRCSITTDMWTSAANRGYMVVTLHWIDEDWNFRSVILGFRRVEYPHTGPRLADHLLDVVKAMDGALLVTIWAVTTDNAKSNGTMIRSIRAKLPAAIQEHIRATVPSSAADTNLDSRSVIGEPHNVFQVRCLAHVLQLAAKEGITKCKLVDDSIGIVRDILRKLKDSTSMNEELQRICSVLNVKFQQPELDCVTRWNSTWAMVMSAIRLRKPIEELLRRIRDRHAGYSEFSIGPDNRLAAPIEDDTWGSLNEFCKFLTPVKAATMMMSGKNYPTFGMAMVVFELVSKNATKAILQTAARYTSDFATAFKKKLDEYDEVVKSREAQIAAVLDPRAKALLPKVMDDMAPVKQYIIDEYEANYRARYESQQQDVTAPTLHQQEAEDIALGEVLYQMIDDNFG
ncbi:hypothetical protein PR001_g30070, partial [Phytophthora rubi]